MASVNRPNRGASGRARTGSRPRQERGIATRRKVVSSAIDCLADVGYANLTTGRVAKLAEVSDGALFRYFPTKTELLAAALREYWSQMRTSVARAVEQNVEDSDGPAELAHLLVRTHWQAANDPKSLAMAEVYAASRMDPALARAIARATDADPRAERELALASIPEVANAPGAIALLRAMTLALDMAALERAVGTLSDGQCEELLLYFERLCRAELSSTESSPNDPHPD